MAKRINAGFSVANLLLGDFTISLAKKVVAVKDKIIEGAQKDCCIKKGGRSPLLSMLYLRLFNLPPSGLHAHQCDHKKGVED